MVATGLGIASAGMQIWGGMQAKDEARYNATHIRNQANYNAGVLEQQAEMIEQKKQLQLQRDNRMIRFAEGKITAAAATKGIEMSGTALAVLNDVITQHEMDKAIGQYNLSMEKYGVMSQAEGVRRKGYVTASAYERSGDTAMLRGIAGGLSTLYQTGAYAHTRKFNVDQGAKTAVRG